MIFNTFAEKEEIKRILENTMNNLFSELFGLTTNKQRCNGRSEEKV